MFFQENILICHLVQWGLCNYMNPLCVCMCVCIYVHSCAHFPSFLLGLFVVKIEIAILVSYSAICLKDFKYLKKKIEALLSKCF